MDLAGLHGAWTGTQINDLYESDGTFGTTQEDAGGLDDRFAYSAQGNAVTNNTVAALQMGFTDVLLGGCDLPARLMIAMEAVPLASGGDARCIRADLFPNDVSGTPAAGGFIKVQDAEGNYIIDINVIDDGKVDPTIELKVKYDEWRAANPCPDDEQGTVPPTNPPTNSETETTTTSGPSSTVDAPAPPTDEPTNAPSGASVAKSIISVSSSVVAMVLLLN